MAAEKKQEIDNLINQIETLEDLLSQAKYEIGNIKVTDVLKDYDEGRLSAEERDEIIEYIQALKTVIVETPYKIQAARDRLNEAVKDSLDDAKPKKNIKLGGWHITISYIYVPLCIILYALAFFSELWLCITQSFSANYPYMLAYAFTAFVGAMTFISMIQQNKQAYYLIHIFFVCLLFCSTTDYIAKLMLHENVLSCIPIYIIPRGFIFWGVHRYYSKRQDLLNNIRMGSFMQVIDEKLPSFVTAILIFVSFDVYGESVYQMFQEHIGYGLFGVFVPGISQFTHLIHTGFTTVYAFDLYFLCLTFAFSIVVGTIST